MKTEAIEFRRDFEDRTMKFQEREDKVDGFMSKRNTINSRNNTMNFVNKGDKDDLDNQV